MQLNPLTPTTWFGRHHLLTLSVVIVGHLGVLGSLWQARSAPLAQHNSPLMVSFVPTAIDKPQPRPVPAAPPKPVVRPQVKPAPAALLATPSTSPQGQDEAWLSPAQTVPLSPAQVTPPAVAASAEPTPTAPPAPLQTSSHVAMADELALACPSRTPPRYPALSRRHGETGRVVLQVELAPSGEVTSAKVHQSSGHARLDEAALSAVRTWHCTPPTRNGQAVLATAWQPFQFVIPGDTAHE